MELCYVMLYYVMLCYVMLCYVMLCYGMVCYVIHDFILSIDDIDAGPGPSSPPKRPKKRNIQHSEEVPYTASIVVNVTVPKESKEEVKKIQSNYHEEKITKEGKNRKVCVTAML